jgi:hypothetical protein
MEFGAQNQYGHVLKNFVRPLFKRSFQVRDFFFEITVGIGPTGVGFHF